MRGTRARPLFGRCRVARTSAFARAPQFYNFAVYRYLVFVGLQSLS